MSKKLCYLCVGWIRNYSLTKDKAVLAIKFYRLESALENCRLRYNLDQSASEKEVLFLEASLGYNNEEEREIPLVSYPSFRYSLSSSCLISSDGSHFVLTLNNHRQLRRRIIFQFLRSTSCERFSFTSPYAFVRERIKVLIVSNGDCLGEQNS